MFLFLQNRNRLTDIESKLVIIRGEREMERDKLGIWDYEITNHYV